GGRKTPPGTAPPYPAGFAVLRGDKGDRLLIANNLSDNAVLLDVASGQILKSFDLSRSKYVPAAYPYTVVANKAGTKAGVSLWNASEVPELNLTGGGVTRHFSLIGTAEGSSPSSHPTAMLLGENEEALYVALANSDTVAGVNLNAGTVGVLYHTTADGHGHNGSVP